MFVFDFVNLKFAQKELVRFGMYSCNWTAMNLKFKQLMLLSMRMNEANKLMLKVSPKRIINLQLFTSVSNQTSLFVYLINQLIRLIQSRSMSKSELVLSSCE